MRILKWLATILATGALAVFAACAPTSTIQPTAALVTATPADDSSQVPSVSNVVGAPAPRSDVEAAFDKPLSSGLSVAEVTEKVLPSVVRVLAGSSSGTGFIINEDGLTVTNKHVVKENNRVAVRLATGEKYQGRVTQRHPRLDLAYVQIDANRRFPPIAVGDSDKIRVGEDVIAIGFPLGQSLGLEPTVSLGIISAKRLNRLQTDASLNPGNSGGPLLDTFGQAVGVVMSRMETNDAGRPITGIGFAIPINVVKSGLGGQAPQAGKTLPTPTLTSFPAIAPPPNVKATKAALDALDAHRRQVEQATRTAIEAKREAERYTASLEATRIAELPTPTPTPPPTATPTPTPTPTPEPTPTPLPTPTPHPRTFCQEWESLVLEWIKQGNNYRGYPDGGGYRSSIHPDVPDHPQLSAKDGGRWCLTRFPFGILIRNSYRSHVAIGDGPGQLLPGLYEYRREGADKRVPGNCELVLNIYEDNEQTVEMPYGKPFTFRFYQYHGKVDYGAVWKDLCDGALYRIGD